MFDIIAVLMTNDRLGWCAAAEADAVPAADWLSPGELEELDALSPRRRRDRMAGRVAAKRALTAHLREELGWDADPRELVIANDEEGRPLVRLPRGTPAGTPSISLSHSGWGGLCAVAAPGERVGCDLEAVVPRPREVLAFVAAPDELGSVDPSDPAAQARLWTGKEAVLKLLGLGLDADAKMVEVRAGGAEVRLGGLPARRWEELGRPRITVAFTPRDGFLAAVARTGGTHG